MTAQSTRRAAFARAIEPLEPRRLLSTTVDFESLSIGPVGDAAGVYDDPSGFRFALRTAGGAAAGHQSQVYGTPQGFPSKVLHPKEWAQQFVVTRQDGQSFDLESFDYAASRYGDAGDFVLTGFFEAGGTQQETVAFTSSKTPQTLDLNWNDLTSVRIAFGGGVNSAYGALDNFVFDTAGESAFEFFAERVVVEAEQFDANTPRGEHSWQQIDDGVGGAMQALPPNKLQIDSNIEATSPRLDYQINFPAAGEYIIWVRGKGVAGAVATSDSLHVGLNGVVQIDSDKVIGFGTDWTWSAETMDATGHQFEARLDVPSAGVHTVNLYMREDGLAVDRFFIGTDPNNFPMVSGPRASERAPGGSTSDPATADGSLAGEGPLTGPVDVSFDGLNLQDVAFVNAAHVINPLPDGRFYLIGGSGSTFPDQWTAAYITRHHADGSIDRTFADNGRRALADDSLLLRNRLHPQPNGGFLIITSEPGEPITMGRLTNDLLPDPDYGTGGEVPSGGSFEMTPDGGLLTVAADGEDLLWTRYDVAGDQVSQQTTSDPTAGRTAPNGSPYGSMGILGVAEDGSVLLGLQSEDFIHRGFMRLTPGLTVDESYGGDGVADLPLKDTDVFVISIEASADGRLFIAEYDPDGPNYMTLLSASGEFTADRVLYHQALFFPWSQVQDVAARFHDDGDVSVAYTLELINDDGRPVTEWQPGFGADRFNADGTHDSSFEPFDIYPRHFGDETLEGVDATLMPDGSFAIAGKASGDALLWRVNTGEDAPASVVVDFESAAVGQIASGIYTDQGFTFFNRPGGGGTSLQPLIVHGSGQGYASKVLSTTNWARRIDIQKDGGGEFDLASFDYAAGRWGEAGDFVLTGYFAGGATDTRTVPFSSKQLTTLDLDWTDLELVSVNFAGGVNSAYGAVDNFVFGSDGQEDQPPTTTGSLNDPDPVAGPVRIQFDGRSWNEAYALLPLPDGSFYVVGEGGLEPADPTGQTAPASRQDPTATRAYVTRHFADGSIDTSFGDAGRIDLPEELRHLIMLPLFQEPASDWLKPIGGGFLVRGSGGFVKLDFNLQLVGTFGSGGILEAAGDFTPLPGGGFAILDGEVVRVFDSGGSELDSANVYNAILPRLYDGDTLLYRRIGDIAADGAGNIYIGVSNNAKPYAGDPSGGPFVGVARFTPGLDFDESYGSDGFARFSASDTEHEIHSGVFVAEDGRVLIGIDENDGHRDVVYFAADGSSYMWRRYGADADVFAASFLDDGTVAFAARAAYQEGGSIVVEDGVRHPFAFYRVDEPFIWSEDDFINFDDFDIPQRLRDVFVAADGSFVAAGYLEDVATNASGFPTDVAHHGALWRIAFPLERETTVDFESAAVGQIASGLYTENGFTFSNRPGSGGSTLQPLIVHGPAQGYASKVLSTTNWARRIDVTRDGGGTFGLASFDYAAGRWGEAGDFLLTGFLAGGGTLTRTVAFNSKTLTTLELDWQNLTSLSINYSGGVNSAYGAVDNFVFSV